MSTTVRLPYWLFLNVHLNVQTCRKEMRTPSRSGRRWWISEVLCDSQRFETWLQWIVKAWSGIILPIVAALFLKWYIRYNRLRSDRLRQRRRSVSFQGFHTNYGSNTFSIGGILLVFYNNWRWWTQQPQHQMHKQDSPKRRLITT